MSKERDTQVVKEICEGLEVDFENDEQVSMLPQVLRNVTQEALAPKLVIAFLYNPVSEKVSLSTPNIPPERLDLFDKVSEGCMEAAKQYNKIANRIKEEQQKGETVESEEVPGPPIEVDKEE